MRGLRSSSESQTLIYQSGPARHGGASGVELIKPGDKAIDDDAIFIETKHTFQSKQRHMSFVPPRCDLSAFLTSNSHYSTCDFRDGRKAALRAFHYCTVVNQPLLSAPFTFTATPTCICTETSRMSNAFGQSCFDKIGAAHWCRAEQI